MNNKPFSEACERNQEPILNVLKDYIRKADTRLLEIGSGTGQHAVFLAPHFPWLDWYPTELPNNINGIKTWLKEAKISSIKGPTALKIGKDDFPRIKFDVVFTANTFHIMHWKECKAFIKQLGNRLREGALAIFYGPFKYDGQYTSESNEAFDQQLKDRDPQRGIRAFEDINNAMIKNGFELVQDIDMPANNQILIYTRLAFESDNF